MFVRSTFLGTRLVKLGVLALIAAASFGFSMNNAQAGFVQSDSAGAAGFTTNTTVTFSEFLVIPPGTPITNQYSGFGLTFSPGWLDHPSVCILLLQSDCISSSDLTTSYTIDFATVQTQAGFFLNLTTEPPGTIIFEAYLSNTLVASAIDFSVIPFDPNAPSFYGFEGLSFDRIRFDLLGPFIMLLDDLTFDQVDEPATLAIFGLGLAGMGFMRRRRKLN